MVLSRNSVTVLSSGFRSLNKLKVLILEGNNLTSVDFRNIPDSVDTLRLRNNEITTIHYAPSQNKYVTFTTLSELLFPKHPVIVVRKEVS